MIEIKNANFGIEKLEVEDGWTESGNFIEADIAFMSESVTNGGLKPWEEIVRTAEFWENCPVTLEHPDPMPLQDTDEVIGFIQDVEKHEDKKRLGGTVRIYKELPQYNDQHTEDEWAEIRDTVKETRNISVGYHFQPIDESGVYSGEDGEELEYEFIRSKFLPDHTAILNDEEPACPPERGSGINIEKMRQLGYEVVVGKNEDDIMEENNVLKKIKEKLSQIESKLNQSEHEEEIMEEEEEPNGADTGSDRLEEVEAELERLKQENEKLKEQLREYEERHRERLVDQIVDKTDLSEEDLDEKSIDDLKSMLEGIEKIKPKDSDVEMESGKNLNSPPKPEDTLTKKRDKGTILGGAMWNEVKNEED